MNVTDQHGRYVQCTLGEMYLLHDLRYVLWKHIGENLEENLPHTDVMAHESVHTK